MNSKRGYAKITFSDGVERALRYSFNALAEIEDHFGGESIQQIFINTERIAQLKASDWVFLFWAGLKGGGDTEITREEVGDLMDISEMQTYSEAMMQAFNKANVGTDKVPSRGGNTKGPLPETTGPQDGITTN